MGCGLCGRSGHNRRTCPMPDPTKKTEYSSSPSFVVSEPVVRLRDCNRHHCFCRNKNVVFGIAERSETCPWVVGKAVVTNLQKEESIVESSQQYLEKDQLPFHLQVLLPEFEGPKWDNNNATATFLTYFPGYGNRPQHCPRRR
jgi:hypothetical protein